MRSYDKDDEYDRNDLGRLNAQPWQVELLRLNPEYPHWGPYEDYMSDKDGGWRAPIFFESWADHSITLDELNEVVHFYFKVRRESKGCETCAGTGYHPDARWVADSFYRHSSPFAQTTRDEAMSMAVMKRFGVEPREKVGHGYPDPDVMARYGQAFREFCDEMKKHKCWHDRITQDEVKALLKADRLFKWRSKPEPLASEVNAAQSRAGLDSHDGLNRVILIDARLDRLGVPKGCPTCHGHGYVFTAPAAAVDFTYWLIHPRKGASRGVEVKNIQREDLPQVFAFLKQAAERNAARFEKVVIEAGIQTIDFFDSEE